MQLCVSEQYILPTKLSATVVAAIWLGIRVLLVSIPLSPGIQDLRDRSCLYFG